MARYTPTPIPKAFPPEMQAFLGDELRRIAAVMNVVASGQLEELNVEPAKPRNGMVVIADGTNWDPGAGRGVYWYDATVPDWVQL